MAPRFSPSWWCLFSENLMANLYASHYNSYSSGSICLAVFNLFTVLTAHTVSTRAGSVAMLNDDPVLTYLDHHVAPGTEIYAYPYCPMYYFLTATKNPTRRSILLYGYNTPFPISQRC